MADVVHGLAMKVLSVGRDDGDRPLRKRRRKLSRISSAHVERPSWRSSRPADPCSAAADTGPDTASAITRPDGAARVEGFFPVSERGSDVPEPVEETPSGLLPSGPGGYELIRRIASGGMAELLLARRRGLAGTRQEVVIKRLLDVALRDRNIARMFLWEAWITSRLSHPNIVRYCDLFHHRGRYHIVFEHVIGRDVAALAREARQEARPLPLDAVLDIGIGAARGLHHAHGLEDDEGRSVGLIHRDVSPHNLLVSRDGEVKIVDFGVAKTLSSHIPRQTTVGLVKGKMAYVAPEQLTGEAIDARSDLFSLGVVLFELCTGTRLFSRPSDIETLRAVREAAVPSMAALRPDCPASLEAIVRRALERDPAARFASAAEMADALAEVRASIPGPGARVLVAPVVTGENARPQEAARAARPGGEGTQARPGDGAGKTCGDGGRMSSRPPGPVACASEPAALAGRARDVPEAVTLCERRSSSSKPPTDEATEEVTSSSVRGDRAAASEPPPSAPAASTAFPLLTPRARARASLRPIVTLTVAFLVGAAATAVGAQAADRLLERHPPVAAPAPAH
jgi:eukaryotic-like serine/threonine-protein kinase